MKYLIVDTGLAESIAYRLAEEGEKVYYYVSWQRSTPEQSDILYGKGFLEEAGVKFVENYEKYVDDVDVIIFTDVFWGEAADKLREEGKLVWGASEKGTRLENDRGYAKEAGIYEYFPKSKVYSNKHLSKYASPIIEAIKDIEEEEFNRPVIKLNKIGDSSIKTYVSVDNEDAVIHLENLKEKGIDDSTEILVTDYVDGIEVAMGVFVGPDGFVMPWNMNFEHKRLFPGELGKMTGEMGTVIFNKDNSDVDNLFEIMFGKYEKWYKENYGIGYVDINAIVSYKDGKPYYLEHTSRFGYPHISIMLPAIKTPLGKIFYDVTKGIMKRIDISPDWLTGVCANVDNLSSPTSGDNVIIRVKNPDYLYKHIPAGIYKDDKGYIRSVPTHSRVFVAVGMDQTLQGSIDKAYENIEDIIIPNGYYRIDIGLKVFDYIHDLFELGYISSKRYLTVFEE